jgi:Fe-S cluster biogenesis protein NfuA
MIQPPAQQFRERIARIDQLLEHFEHGADAAVQARVRELIQLLLDLNADGIERILELAGELPDGATLLDRMAHDELVSSLLLLHGLHPLDVETRVRQALERVRPYMVSHGGDVSLSSIGEDGVLRVVMEGTCDGCPASQQTITSRVEEAVFQAAPEITAIQVEGSVPHGAPAATDTGVRAESNKPGSAGEDK